MILRNQTYGRHYDKQDSCGEKSVCQNCVVSVDADDFCIKDLCQWNFSHVLSFFYPTLQCNVCDNLSFFPWLRMADIYMETSSIFLYSCLHPQCCHCLCCVFLGLIFSGLKAIFLFLTLSQDSIDSLPWEKRNFKNRGVHLTLR